MADLNWKLPSAILKNLPGILIVVIIAVVGLVLYGEFRSFLARFAIDFSAFKQDEFSEAQKRLDELNRQYAQLADNIARSQTQILSRRELENLLDETVSPLIRERLQEDKAEIRSLSETVARMEGKLDVAVASTYRHRGETRTGGAFDLHSEYVRFADQDGRPGVRVAQVNFDAADLDSPWTVYSEDLRIQAKMIAAQQQTGNYEHFVELEAYNDSDPYYRRNLYRLKVDTSVYYQRKLEGSRWYVWAPHLESGLGARWSVAPPIYGFDVGLSLSALGRTRDDNYLRFLRLGVGFNNEALYGGIYPIGLNLKVLHLPFLRDTWVFPGLGLRNGYAPGFAASLSTTL